MTSDLKTCRHCQSLIHSKARICQHCRGFQSWVAGQADPRLFVVLLAIILLPVGALIYLQTFLKNDAAAAVTVAVTRHYVQPTAEGQQLYVVGTLTPNAEPEDAWVNGYFRVTVRNRTNEVVDTFQVKEKLSLGAVGQSIPVRVSSSLAAKPDDVHAVTLELIRVAEPANYDRG